MCSFCPGVCALITIVVSMMVILITLPASLLFTVKVVQVLSHTIILELTLIFQEYERAVIFRLGRLLSGGARGPGVFFIIPCLDIYEKVDMRTMTFEIPPQEVIWERFLLKSDLFLLRS